MNKVNKKERGHLALLLLHVGWVEYRAKANVPNQRSRFIESCQGFVYRVDVVAINTNG